MRSLLLAVLVLSGGCVLQGGGHLGATFHPQKRSRTKNGMTWAGHAQARLALQEVAANLPVQLGLELEGRVERTQGALLTGGPQLGWSFWADQPVSLDVLFDAGVPMGWGVPLNGHYLGVIVELPSELTPSYASDVNRNYRFIGERAAVVPYVRARGYWLRPAETQSGTLNVTYELVFGLSIRSRIFSDLL